SCIETSSALCAFLKAVPVCIGGVRTFFQQRGIRRHCRKQLFVLAALKVLPPFRPQDEKGFRAVRTACDRDKQVDPMLADKLLLFAMQCFGDKRGGGKLDWPFDNPQEGDHLPTDKDLRRSMIHWCACKGTQFKLVRRTIQQRDELRMQRGMNLLHDFTGSLFETSCLLYLEDYVLKHPLRIVTVAEKAAIDAIEPLLPFPIQNRRH